MATKLFITGVTGYIGSAVLSLLLQHRDSYSISALVRSAAAAISLRDLGITPILGTLDDSDILQQAALESDVVLNIADCAHLGAAQALVKGLKAKKEKGLLIHTSGTAIVSDDSKGEYASQDIFSDLDVSALRAFPAGETHKRVDDWLLDNTPDNIKVLIVCPPLVYGELTTPAPTGLQKRQSYQIPFLVDAYLSNCWKGQNIWSNLHIQDLAEFYMLLLDKALNGEADSKLDTGWYFVKSGEHQFGELAAAAGDVLHRMGKIESAETVVFTDAQLDEYLFGHQESYSTWGSNSRCRADRARSLGWQPKRANELFACLEQDLEAAVAESRWLTFQR